jgi:hypothetical protein
MNSIKHHGPPITRVPRQRGSVGLPPRLPVRPVPVGDPPDVQGTVRQRFLPRAFSILKDQKHLTTGEGRHRHGQVTPSVHLELLLPSSWLACSGTEPPLSATRTSWNRLASPRPRHSCRSTGSSGEVCEPGPGRPSPTAHDPASPFSQEPRIAKAPAYFFFDPPRLRSFRPANHFSTWSVGLVVVGVLRTPWPHGFRHFWRTSHKS